MRKAVLLTIALASTSAFAEVQTVTKPATFEQCQQLIRQTATDLGVAPVNVVETTAIRTVRFPSEDGSVLVTCMRDEKKMIIMISSKK